MATSRPPRPPVKRATSLIALWWVIALAAAYWLLPAVAGDGWDGADDAIFFGGYGLWSLVLFLLLRNVRRGGRAIAVVARGAAAFGVIMALGVAGGLLTGLAGALLGKAYAVASLGMAGACAVSAGLLFRAAWLLLRTDPETVILGP